MDAGAGPGAPSGWKKNAQAARLRLARSDPLPRTARALRQGAYFRGHMDVHVEAGRPNTPRVATALIYLTDGPEDGSGETYFPLGVAVEGPLPEGVGRGASDNCKGYGVRVASARRGLPPFARG